ncbi:unnamed protein product [Paramecium octaurelia]|uniref:Uncharacterized protein n=1 Tax=Paramecium octaurelia TaxID=43137 RepID=A0A8S1SXW9_PAROT|nr:unnamed protein product [Paramecium octaurelia]
MNCFHTIDQNLILQQQLILHQMLIYNQMLKASFIQKIPPPNILTPKQEEIDISNSQQFKHDETHEIPPQKELNIKIRSHKISKKTERKKPQKQHPDNKQSGELPKKKKVFLSMLDIKEAQYKKVKAQNNEDNHKSVAAVAGTQI